MRKIFLVLLCTGFASLTFAQFGKPVTGADMVKKAGDHFMVQLGHNIWSGAPDSISSRTKGLNRSANIYLMLNKPFKGDGRFAVGLGLGIGTANMYFKKTNIEIAGAGNVLNFMNADSTNHYKKYKLTTAFLEAPLELRFSSKPLTPNKSVKAALGVKVGTLLNVHTKGKTLQNSSDATISNRTEKILSKSFFNSTRVAATARIGYGIFGLYGTYSLTPLFKDGAGADIKPIQIGITISGL